MLAQICSLLLLVVFFYEEPIKVIYLENMTQPAWSFSAPLIFQVSTRRNATLCIRLSLILFKVLLDI